MFLLFLHFTSSYDQRYSIVPPIELTNISEIGNWTLRGSGTIMKKKYIRLASANVDDYGTICQRVPTMFETWDVELEFNIKDGTIGGEIFGFIFSEELCPELPEEWNGVFVYINTTLTDKNGNSPLYVVPNDGKLIDFNIQKPVAQVKVRNLNFNSRLRLTRKGTNFAGFLIQGSSQTLTRLFDITIPKLIRFGYFTITGLSHMQGDSFDLVSLTTYSPQIYDRNEFDYDISQKNRKIIEDAVLQRRELKKQRRAQMVTSMKYHEEKNQHRDSLFGLTNRLRDSLSIIHEADLRVKETVTILQLQKFINFYVMDMVKQVTDKTDKTFSNFADTETQVNELWTDLQNKLRDLGMETRRDMEKLQNEVMNIAKRVKIEEIDPNSLLSDHLNGKSSSGFPINQKILVAIMIVEFIGYIVFLFVKRKKLHGFKND